MPMDISTVVALPATTGSAGNLSGVARSLPAVAAPGVTHYPDALPTGAQTPSMEQVQQSVKQVNDTFTQRGRNLYATFENDPAAGLNVIKIVDQDTHQVISQLPPKAIVEFARSLEQSHGKSGHLLSFKV